MKMSSTENISGVPLSSLSAVCLDLETTGLDIVVARVVQIGAVNIFSGRIDTEDCFDCLVNPKVPIPAASSRIHNINDQSVSDADDFMSAFWQFEKWSNARLLIGYSIGFDLAILKAEHERANSKWASPRCLDVRHLVELITPNNGIESLEATAQWLGIPVVGRHNALGDALLTAKIFIALLTRLRDLDIVTLAQAERASLNLLSQHESEHRAGWHQMGKSIGVKPESVGTYARIDSYPYRHRVRDAMHSPAVVINSCMIVEDSLQKMMSNRISSAFVEPVGDEDDYGIITERDILRAIHDNPSGALKIKVADVASRPLVSIDQDEFVYRAISMMTSQNFRHLAVTDSGGQLVGALSSRDLLHQRAEDVVALGDSIEQAETVGELGRIWADLTTVARGLVSEQVDARDIAAVISRELCALTQRACEISERIMVDRDRGDPPCNYSMLVLGSGGRGESLLAMDQDNAIIYADGGDEDANDQWFKELGESVADILNAVGVVYCKGGIMAKNTEWRMTRSQWRFAVTNWIRGTTPEEILNADIFFDSTTVYGDVEMGASIRREALHLASRSRVFLNLLSLRANDIQLPINWLGLLRTKNGRIDLKIGGIMPIFSAARVLALRHASPERSTPKRLEAVQDKLMQGQHLIENLIEAHRIFLDLILKQQLKDIETGKKLSNSISPSDLASRDKQSLKWAFNQVRGISDLLGTPTDIW